ncbi:MAG: hypothetical protein J7485_10445 [Sphingobium sp.]|nr:hypothetical protein [Sphingobium sp.]
MSLADLAAPRRRLRILRRPTEQIRPSTPRAQRRDCHGRLIAALLALAGEAARIDDASFRPWCSATFLGAQHRITLRIAGKDTHARTDQLARNLPEAELVIPGHIVADVAVDAVTPQDDGTVLIALAVLTIEDW